MYSLAVYGKGGVGKSTVSANLSYLLSMHGSVLHVGCDPKHDSTRLLTGGVPMRTFSADTSEVPVAKGDNGVSCIECGGAEPGAGCAGKGLEMLFSGISGIDADYRVSDVLGDVVCGGFSVPARRTNADAILIVTSGEFMSLFAANNIMRGLQNINPGACVMGLVLNRRGDEGEEDAVRRFSEACGVPVVCDIPRSGLFAKAEAEGATLCSLFAGSDEAEALGGLADLVRSRPRMYEPTPLSDDQLDDLAAGRPLERGCHSRRRQSCSFDTFDTERNVTYVGAHAVPSCTSHGAADAAMRISDAATVIHGPANCAYLMEFAFRRRMANTSGERSGGIPPCNVYSTRMDASGAFTDTGDDLAETVRRAVSDGFHTVFIVSTCTTEIMSSSFELRARELSVELGADVIAVEPDRTFLGSKFGGTFGLFDALICRMPPCGTEPGTVNLVARWFYGAGRDRNIRAISRILELMGLRVNTMFLDLCSMDDVRRFRRAEFDIQLGRSSFNDRISERISSVTGRRRALTLEVPVGLADCMQWAREIGDYTGRPERAEEACRILREEFESGISRFRSRTEGRRAAVYARAYRDIAWQVDTLRGMGMDVATIFFADGHVIDHNERVPEFPGVDVVMHAKPADFMLSHSREAYDIVVTNDPVRLRSSGCPWCGLGSRSFGLEGAIEWAGVLADCLDIPVRRWEAGL